MGLAVLAMFALWWRIETRDEGRLNWRLDVSTVAYEIDPGIRMAHKCGQ